MVGWKGSDCHLSSGPGGTTSMWPASATSGPEVPCRIHRLVTSPHLNTSLLNPSGTSRSTIICWQPASSGVMERRAMSAFASSRVSFFKGEALLGVGGSVLAPRDRGADAALDVAAQLGARADGERGFGKHEERPDEELLRV